MENKELINKIKSNYILNNILDYIKDTNFKLKLFIHSKLNQNKLNLKVIYKEIFLEKIGFNLDKYLNIERFSANAINMHYQEFLSDNKLNKEEFENILYEILKNSEDINENISNRNEDVNKLIYIESPLFEIISKANKLDKYTININFIDDTHCEYEDNEEEERKKK